MCCLVEFSPFNNTGAEFYLGGHVFLKYQIFNNLEQIGAVKDIIWQTSLNHERGFFSAYLESSYFLRRQFTDPLGSKEILLMWYEWKQSPTI